MTRSGPCRHCGVTCSPMWRKGPAEKAVLCNACGTRYRHRGHLNNYLPKLSKPNVDHYLNKLPSLTLKLWGKPLTNLAISYHQGEGLLKFVIPTRKRSRRVCRSRIFCKERFQKQLFDEWVRQGKPMNESSQHLLLSDNANNFIPTNEIGVGAILLKLDATSI